jgi:hypothetical protein
VGYHEEMHETSGSIKCGKFLDQLGDYELLKKNSPLWSWLVVAVMWIEGYMYKCKFPYAFA